MNTPISGFWCWSLRLVSCATIGSAIAFTDSGGLAQIVPDQSLGPESTIVTPKVNLNGLSIDRIDGGAKRGVNLFHSFQKFSVGEGNRVYFANPSGVDNIFSRVTGTEFSHILGTLGVLGNANLFLLNPNGIIFGPNARLDVRGSFLASTANSLKFSDGTLFSTENPTAPPLLTINMPLGLQFGTQKPAGIVNAGQLNVPEGQNLSLLGGTVVSTGQLAAPGGQLTVASVLGGSEVQLSSSGLPLSISPIANPQLSTTHPPSLSQMLNDAGGVSTLGITLTDSGEVKLAAADLKVADGDVVVRQLTSGNATLWAANNLTLVESQLNTTLNLHLLAQNTVQVRDSVALPFVAQAGGKLLIEGNYIDISALNHPQSGFFSGGDMMLRSPNPVAGDAHYTTSGNFRIEQPNGSLGNLLSPDDPVIRASGDVSFGGYQGASLHIFAGGSVTIPGGVVIGAADPINDRSIDNVMLSDGTPVLINRATQPTLDVRAGTTAFGVPGITGVVLPLGRIIPPIPNLSAPATSANITIGSITNSGGLVLLTNQYQPNPSLPGGAIKVTGQIITGSQSGNGGSVIIDSRSTLGLQNSVNASSGNFVQGKGGDVTLIANGDINASEILSLGGLGGNINLTSSGRISIQDHPLSTISFTPLPGTKGGDINVKAELLSLTDGSLVVAATAGAAQGGNLNVAAKESVEVSGIDAGGIRSSILLQEISGIPMASDLLTQTAGGLYTLTLGAGAAGDVNIQTGQLITKNGTRVASYTRSQGHGGNLTLIASDAVQVSGTIPLANGGLFAETYGAGDAGNLTIDTKRLIVRDGALVSASNVSGQGNGGNLTVNASDSVEISGNTSQGRYNSGLGIYARGTGNSGQLTINTRQLSLQDGGFIATASFNQNQGGNLTINAADSVKVSGISSVNGIPSALSTDTFARTNAGNAGNLTINTGQLMIQDGGIVSASTFGSGQGGRLVVNASQLVELSGFPSGLYAQGFSSGKAGNLQVKTNQLSVQNGAKVTVATGPATSDLNVVSGSFNFGGDLTVPLPQQAIGDAGEMTITANSIQLDHGGSLIAKTVSGEGGNINLQVRDLILMRRNSQISTDARGGTGNGGNININSPLIVAIPTENSDITANALRGRGGNIDITTQGIYGLQFRPHQTPLSDITASSDVTGLQGKVQINTLGIDPSKGLVTLPSQVVNVSGLVGQGCDVAARQQPSKFVVTGRGGVPSNPNETLRNRRVLVDLGPVETRNSASLQSSHAQLESTTLTSPMAPIVEAQGWVLGAKGEVILTAELPTVKPHSSWQKFPNCQGSSGS